MSDSLGFRALPSRTGCPASAGVGSAPLGAASTTTIAGPLQFHASRRQARIHPHYLAPSYAKPTGIIRVSWHARILDPYVSKAS